MFTLLRKSLQIIVPIVLLQLSFSASAQATRTWVSGVGDDANPCSRTAPCKTFAGAISKTAAGGEINAIDSGGFGAVAINKSIVIDGRGVMASILSAGTNGVVINAAATDVVVLRNIIINGAGTGLNGVRFITGKSLHIEDCVIENVTQKGIDAESSSANNELFVRDTMIRNNADPTNGLAIFVKPAGGATTTVSLDNVRMDRNNAGFRVEDNVKATVRNSVVADSLTGNGFIAFSAGAPAEIYLDRSTASGNLLAGVKANGGLAKVFMTNSSVLNNGQGLAVVAPGQIISLGNNTNVGNAVPGAPTSNVALQ